MALGWAVIGVNGKSLGTIDVWEPRLSVEFFAHQLPEVLRL